MAKRPTLTDLTSLTNSSAINALSENWDAIEEAFDNTLSLDGSTPNAMNADLDLNGNALLNVGTIDVTNLTLDGQTITDIATVPEWRGAWVTSTNYAKNDLVKANGNVYICLVAHTSDTFATDLTALNWELMVSKGDSGAGTGDMLGANNLSDLADDATARANLGLGAVATENTVPVAKGGTGATDAATARANLGLGALAVEASVTTTLIAAGTLVTEAEGISSNDNDTTIPTSAAVLDLVTSRSGRSLLASRTASASATLDFTEFNNATYLGYEFVLENVKPANDGVTLAFRLSTDGGSTYDSGGTHYSYAMIALSVGGSVVTSTSSGDSRIEVTTSASIGNLSGERGVSGTVRIFTPDSSTQQPRVRFETQWDNSTSTALTTCSGNGVRRADQDTTAIRFFMTTGNIGSGRISMYGLL